MLELDKVKDKAVVHFEGNSNRGWLEFPKISYITNETSDKKYCLVFANLLTDQPQLVQEIKDLYGSEVKICERWVNINVAKTRNGYRMYKASIIEGDVPIVRDGFTHTLSFVSDDENYLKFIQWDIKKKLNERAKLSKLDIAVKDKDEFKIAGGEFKGDVDIPEFLKVATESASKETSTLDSLFDEMDKIIDSFFKRFE